MQPIPTRFIRDFNFGYLERDAAEDNEDTVDVEDCRAYLDCGDPVTAPYSKSDLFFSRGLEAPLFSEGEFGVEVVFDPDGTPVLGTF